MSKLNFAQIIVEASDAAKFASTNANPTPMVVGLATSIFSNDIVPGTEEVVNEGVCGFAWIKISGRGGFAKYVRENQLGGKGVYGGVQIWASAFDGYNGQSLERKEASMRAASEILTKHGIKNSVHSRMD